MSSDIRVHEGVESRGATPRVIRPEIQALRALAVSLVVVYHVAPQVLHGGYVGVDVFLVISGYLITGHLAKEIEANGRLNLLRFYERRARRLLPASLTVLAVTAVAAWLFMPRTLWETNGLQVLASAFYVENWYLAADAVDYLGQGTATSAVQHFWSLGVEEQFYVFWPLALLLMAVTHRRLGISLRAVLVVGVSALAAASIVYSVVSTANNAGAAYFSTPVRVWEFALGGLAWLLLRNLRIGAFARTLLSSTGVLLILVSAVMFSDATPFPGHTALLPTIGAVAVIAAGNPSSRFSLGPLMRSRPVQYVGNISYSLYLWHWPLIVILPFALSTQMTIPLRAGIVAASFALAVLSYHFVESLAQKPRSGSSRSWIAMMLVGMLIVGGAGALLAAQGNRLVLAAQSTFASQRDSLPPAFGATAVNQFDPVDIADIFPPALAAPDDGLNTDSSGTTCQEGGAFDSAPTSCHFGVEGGPRIVLVGDSHAAQWLPALASLAVDQGWQLDTYLRSGCPLSYTYPTRAGDDGGACMRWVDAVVGELRANPADHLFVSASSGSNYNSPTGIHGISEGMADAWRATGAASLTVIRDNPSPQRAGIADVPTCLDRASSVFDCDAPRRAAVLEDPLVGAADAFGERARLVDLTDEFCEMTRCPAVVGGATVYRDGHHLTATFVRTLREHLLLE